MDKYLTCIKNIMKEEDIDVHETKNHTEKFQGDSYMGTLMKIEIIGKNKFGEKVTRNVIIKIATDNEQVRSLVTIRQFYLTEIYAYKNIFPAFETLQNKLQIPQKNKFIFINCYYTCVEESKEFLIIQNVGPDGFLISPRKQPLDFDHVKIVLQHLARFHSLSFALKKLEPDTYQEIVKNVEVYKGYSKNFHIFIYHVLKNALQYIHNEKYREKFEKVTSYEKFLELTSPEICHPYNVICHGDFWQSNILFKYKNKIPIDVRFIDWQLNKHCSPITDLSHFLFSVTEQSLRDEHYEDLINVYYKTLSENLYAMNCDPQELYPENVFRHQLKTILIYALLFGTVALTFSLREDDELCDLETSIEILVKNNEYNFGFNNPSSASQFTRRVEDMIGHLIKLGVLE